VVVNINSKCVCGSGEFEIGFVFSRFSNAYILVILFSTRSYIDFGVWEIGFVLHINTCLGSSEVVGLKLASIVSDWVCFSGVREDIYLHNPFVHRYLR